MSNGDLLYRINPARNMRRFYHLSVETDLLGDTILIRRWGRIGTYGQRRVDVCQDASKANLRAAELVRLKQRRGYRNADEDSQKSGGSGNAARP